MIYSQNDINGGQSRYYYTHLRTGANQLDAIAPIERFLRPIPFPYHLLHLKTRRVLHPHDISLGSYDTNKGHFN